MSQAYPVIVPLINANETEAKLVDIAVKENQWVEAGTPICILETTKSTYEVIAEKAGFVYGLHFQKGDSVQYGEILLWLLEDIHTKPDLTVINTEKPAPHTYGISDPAIALAKEHNLDLSIFPRDHFITKADVQRYLDDQQNPLLDSLEISTIQDDQELKNIILYGGGGHAKMLIDLLRSGKEYHIVGILDDSKKKGSKVMDVPILGGESLLQILYNKGIRLAINAVGGIGNIQARIRINDKLTSTGFSLPPVSHPSAIIEPGVKLSPGTQIFARAYVGSEVQLGYATIVSTGAIISHDCILEDYAIVSPGAILAGEVRIGARALIGMGVTINLNVSVGSGAKIGNHATVNSNVPAGTIVQAGKIWQ